VLVRSAWVCDDAYISFRTVDNLVNGAGLRWNPDERVQAFTHPLWLLLVSAAYAATREPYYTSVALSLALSCATLWVLWRRLAVSPWNGAVAFAALLSSKAFVDYSTSGLENPLSHLLLAAFLAGVWRRDGDGGSSSSFPGGARVPDRDGDGATAASLLAFGLLLVNRQDLGLLATPVLSHALISRPPRRWLRALALSTAPLVAWELFSVAYFGYPFPNTAYAKLATGIPADELLRQGLWYFRDSLARDPLTLSATAAALVVAVSRRQAWPAAVGVALYLFYVCRIGGDFMSGRFLAAPALCAVAILARGLSPGPQTAAVIVIGALALGVSSHRAPLRAGVDYGVHPRGDAMVDGRGVADERGYYYPFTGLLRVIGQDQIPNHHWALDGRRARLSGPRVVQRTAVGFFACLAGPEVHVVDLWALTDPLLARLPLDRSQGWRVGHYPRALPEGYLETLRSGRNRIADPRIAALWDDVARATRGPLWAPGRWESLIRLNLPGRAQR